MNLTSLPTIKELLAKFGAVPKKKLGQNFLINPKAGERVVTAASLQPQDLVVEVGPGIGTLTKMLAPHAQRILAVEKDRKMVDILQETMAGYPNVELIHADILKWAASLLRARMEFLAPSKDKKYKLVANLPYSAASPIIRMFLEAECPPKVMVVMVQKEVAQRITASPPDMSMLALSVQFYGKPEVVEYVSKGSFWPRPKVDSAILRITPHKRLKTRGREFIAAEQFFRAVKAGFSHPRRQLINNLAEGLAMPKEIVGRWLSQNGVDPARRAETLFLKEWLTLAETLPGPTSQNH
ncbi:ribosomal RNA small subunit methyltransferase A [Patescibacteria group bacterium]|nr:ribosomal RNA small subunit methyltransferase A [Patescibacteria group bacterium]